MNKNKLWLILGISLIIQISVTSCKKKSETKNLQQAQEYPVEVLTNSDTELQNTYPAVLKGEQDIEIKPRIDGFIDDIYVDEGSIVRKGQVLFKINSPSSVEALASAQASYNSAKLDVERLQPLVDKGIISDVKIKSYENILATAKANLAEAKAALSWTTVTSPVNGVVGTIQFRQGSLVNNASVLTTVANISNVIANFSINEKDLISLLNEYAGNSQNEKIKNMPPVKLLLADNSEYNQFGYIKTISGIVDGTSGSVNIRAQFPNKEGLLRSGASAKVVISQKLKDAIVIPQKATFAQQDKVLVYTCQGDSVVQRTINVEATADGKYYVVTDGLSTGETVVVDGIATLSNGQKIKQKIISQQ